MYAYFAQRGFSPILASPYKETNNETSGDVVVEVISDAPRQYRGSLRVRVFKLTSLSPIFDQEVEITAVSASSYISPSIHILACLSELHFRTT